MTRDDVIRMAEEAGIGWASTIGGMPEFLERFAELVVAVERKACAKVCDDIIAYDEDDPMQTCADAIRARGKK